MRTVDTRSPPASARQTTPSGMPPRPDNAGRTHRPRGPSGVARGCEAFLYHEKRRVFRMILAHYLLRVDGKQDVLCEDRSSASTD